MSAKYCELLATVLIQLLLPLYTISLLFNTTLSITFIWTVQFSVLNIIYVGILCLHDSITLSTSAET